MADRIAADAHFEVDAFLRDFPLMAVRPPRANNALGLKGVFAFTARSAHHGDLTDNYELRIDVPRFFPKALPIVTELAGKIPLGDGFHVNPDHSLCLGSPLRLLLKLAAVPTLVGFVDSCLVPYLFAISYKLRNGGVLLFDELAHGIPGMIADYIDLFGLASREQVVKTLKLLGMKKRLANKQQCPCGCRLRLGKCAFNRRLSPFRPLASRSLYRSQTNDCDDETVQVVRALMGRERLIEAAAAGVVRSHR